MSEIPASPGETDVRHNAGAKRFEALVDGHLSVVDYEVNGDAIVLTRTFVPPELRGRGLAEKLVRAALAWAAAEKRRIVPACSYVDTFVRRHPEFQALR